MIAFRLTDGRIVEAVKDCACLPTIHEGPCWLHSSDLLREIIEQRIAKRGGFVDRNTAIDEVNRLRDRLQDMEKRGIVAIIRNYEGPVE